MSNYQDALYDAAEEACDIAFANASYDLKTLKGGRMCFYPIADEQNEQFGIGVNPDYHYLIYQENGFASFPMKWAYGRVIPMMINGKLIYRRCTGVGELREGYKNYWQRGLDGELMAEYRQKLSWVHPGLPPKNFMADAIYRVQVDRQNDFEAAILKDRFGTVGGTIIGKIKNLANRIKERF